MDDAALGRLVCVGIRGAKPGEAQLEHDLEACRSAGVGGVILFDVDVPTCRQLQAAGVAGAEASRRATRNIVDPVQVAELVAHIRDRLGAHVFVSIDQEGGRVARLSANRGFAADPSAAAFAAMEPAARVEAAERQASRLRQLGFDLNFAPCVDLALDPENEIIAKAERSYGRDPERVIELARIVLEAHARAGVAACLKHFPGHGSSRGDTHRGIVDVTDTWRAEAELVPYEALCHHEGLAVMVAHVVHRGLDPSLPASLSPAVIGDLLRGRLGYEGVVVTDSIDMRSIVDHFAMDRAAHSNAGGVRDEAASEGATALAAGRAVVAAVEAGADLVVDGFNLEERQEHPAPALVGALRRALGEGRLRRERIDESLRRLERLRAEIGHPS